MTVESSVRSFAVGCTEALEGGLECFISIPLVESSAGYERVNRFTSNLEELAPGKAGPYLWQNDQGGWAAWGMLVAHFR